MSIDKILLKDKEPKKVQVIKKIVITGGSDAGKTTAMNWIQNNFEKKGYKVIFIDSAAKEFINDGVLKKSIICVDAVACSNIYLETDPAHIEISHILYIIQVPAPVIPLHGKENGCFL